MMQTLEAVNERSACVGSAPQRLATSFAHYRDRARGLTEDDLNLRGGPNGWSDPRNRAPSVEPNLVACHHRDRCGGTGGCTYDCSWLSPDRAWMERMGYRGAVAPAIEVLSASCRYVSALLRAAPDGLRREIKLLGAPGTEPCPMTVEQMICQEVEHARHHLQEIDGR